MMKLPILLMLVMLAAPLLLAQEAAQDSVVEENAVRKAGFWLAVYGEPAYSSAISGANMGGGAVFLYNESFFAGAYGVVFTGQYEQRLIFPNEFRLNYSHAGIWVGYRTNRAKPVAFTADLKMGEGKVFWERLDNFDNMFEDYALFINPALGVDLQFLDFFALHAGVGFRSVHGLDVPRFSNSDFGGVSFKLMLKVGIF